MIRQKWIWIILLFLLIVSSPSIINRWNSEVNNDIYEIAAPYEEIYTLTTEGILSMEEVLLTLKDAGLSTVSLEPTSLNDLEKYGIIEVFDEEKLFNIMRFTNSQVDFNIEKKGLYITIPEQPYYKEMLLEKIHPEEVTIGSESFYFVPVERNISLSTNLGYDELAIEHIGENQLTYILRVNNEQNEIDINQNTIKELLRLKTNENSNLLFSGMDIIGYPNLDQMNNWTKQLQHEGFHFYMIEFSSQKGFQSLARNTDYSIIRLHSINLGVKTLEESVNQAIRAVKERNIRSIFFHLDSGTPEQRLEQATAFISGVVQDMPAHFNLGIPEPFKEVPVSNWVMISLLAAGILFTTLAAGITGYKNIQIIAFISMLLIAITYLLSEKLVLLQGFALIISLLTPIYAVLLPSNNGTDKWSTLTLQFLKALGISVVGINIIIGLLNGNAFLTGIEVFRGVKLVYIIPILFVGLFLFWRIGMKLIKAHGFNVLRAEVKYWHLLLFFLLAAVGLYYISRTGNGGAVSNIELTIRNALEEILYVRPRTKEFLIGFPFFLLALFVRSKSTILGNILLIPGVIGFLSIVNTFTHFHIPLYISLTRTVYSIVIGYIIGILFIRLFRKSYPKIIKAIRKRWS